MIDQITCDGEGKLILCDANKTASCSMAKVYVVRPERSTGLIHEHSIGKINVKAKRKMIFFIWTFRPFYRVTFMVVSMVNPYDNVSIIIKKYATEWDVCKWERSRNGLSLTECVRRVPKTRHDRSMGDRPAALSERIRVLPAMTESSNPLVLWGLATAGHELPIAVDATQKNDGDPWKTVVQGSH